MLDLGGNFRQMKDGKIKCKLGCNEEDSQRHLLNCPYLAGNDLKTLSDKSVYDDLFSNQVEDQLKIAAILETKYKIRREKTKS